MEPAAQPPKSGGQIIEAHLLYMSINGDGSMCSHVAAKIQYPDGHVEERELELPAQLAPAES